MTLGASGRDGLALEFYGGGDLIAGGLPGTGNGEPLDLFHPGQRAVGGLDCGPGEHRSVGARQITQGRGTDEVRCAGA